MDSTYKAEPLSRDKIRAIAKEIRMLCGISDNQAFPVVKFMEYLLDQFGYTYHFCSKEELPKDYAQTVPFERILQIREDVYERAVAGVPRDIFTIAHEIGHVILHDIDTVTFARSDEKIKTYESPEWQANTFAGELIAPADVLDGISIEEIAERYNCSLAVASIQKKHSPNK